MGGPIALVQDGDWITIDAEKKEISVALTEQDLAKRSKQWVAPPLKVKSGWLYKFTKLVSTASEGCVTDK